MNYEIRHATESSKNMEKKMGTNYFFGLGMRRAGHHGELPLA
jgi:hypothetical protein